MNNDLEEQLDAIVGKITNKEYFDQVKEQLLKLGIESLLKAEMIAHLGYNKGVPQFQTTKEMDFHKRPLRDKRESNV